MAFNYLYQCGVCANSYTRIVPLLKSHQSLIEKLHHALKIYTTPNGFPQFACQQCTEKLEIFDNLISKLLRGQEYFHCTNEKMHQNISEPQEGKEDNAELHPYNCQCSDCRDKFGSLPLLVQVIEQESQRERAKTEEIKLPVDVSMPSTSYTPEAESSSPQRTGKQMTCSYCDKMFTHRGDLNKHERTHTGEQPFSCPICKRKFTHTSNLARHIKVHSGDKPFQCNVCSKKFSRKDKLDNHKKTRLCKKYSKRPDTTHV